MSFSTFSALTDSFTPTVFCLRKSVRSAGKYTVIVHAKKYISALIRRNMRDTVLSIISNRHI
ncbi:hypothetical protein prwr041_02700 [Prevotella herbatica]|uniref:Transposase n=1 Tax=Prevotella herbatica TaxID=2801997 RepID=A0ABM7NV50_9BACT|nr:hypothetical protein prwr041_02700 [Prevotella herbatica]